MSNNKSLPDRILAVQKYCSECHIQLDLSFDPVDNSWTAYDGSIDLSGPCENFEAVIEALEADFEL